MLSNPGALQWEIMWSVQVTGTLGVYSVLGSTYLSITNCCGVISDGQLRFNLTNAKLTRQVSLHKDVTFI